VLTRERSLTRETSVAFSQSIQQSKKPSLLPSTSFRAASQLPRYSRFSLAMTSISSPQVAKKRSDSALAMKKDPHEDERERMIEHVTALGAVPSKEKDLAKAGFLKDGFWGAAAPPAEVAAPSIIVPAHVVVDARLGVVPGDGGYKESLDGGYKGLCCRSLVFFRFIFFF
jgi:hypothetical protein